MVSNLETTSKVENLSTMSSRSTFANDQRVIDYFQNEKRFSQRAVSNEAVIELNSESNLELRQEKFYDAFNTTESDYIDYVTTQRQLANYIEATYHLSDLEGEVVTDMLIPVIEIVNPEIVTTYSDCKGVYIANLALNASVAYAAHIACMSTVDATVIGGIICHAAVVIGQTAANYIALDNYETCKKSK